MDNKRYSKTSQRGFLALLAVAIAIVIGVVGVIAGRQFLTNSVSNANDLNAQQAFYSSMSGLENASRKLYTKSITCTGMTGASDFTNASISGIAGTMTVTGGQNIVVNTLSSNINNSASSIVLNNASGFSTVGVAQLDSELISYNGISGNTLQNVVRGTGGTTAVSHPSGTQVIQEQCTLTSLAGVPDLAASNVGTRTLKKIIAGQGFSLNIPGSGATTPAIVAVGNISLGGNSLVTNSYVTSGSEYFTGSTLLSGRSVNLSGSAITQVENSAGNLVTSSTKNTTGGDIVQNASGLSASDLFGYYFNQSKSTVQANADQTYTSSNIAGATGKTIWMNTPLNLSSSVVIGSPTNPVILIVNQDVSLTGGAIIYGFLYATGDISMGGGSQVIGGLATEETLSLTGNATSGVFNAGILATLNNTNGSTNIYYNRAATGIWEIFN